MTAIDKLYNKYKTLFVDVGRERLVELVVDVVGYLKEEVLDDAWIEEIVRDSIDDALEGVLGKRKGV